MKKLKFLIPSALIIAIIAQWYKYKQLMRWTYGVIGILALFTGISLIKHIKERNSEN
ncbi:MAG: hypothetical protein IJI67_04565 [Clostridia bacterium]|nr:hypothetical protein [Clostridia bacterium]